MSKAGFKDINIMKTDPMKEQFEPTEAEPIRQRARMAGDPFFSLRDISYASPELRTPTPPPPSTPVRGEGRSAAAQSAAAARRGVARKRSFGARGPRRSATGRRTY